MPNLPSFQNEMFGARTRIHDHGNVAGIGPPDRGFYTYGPLHAMTLRLQLSSTLSHPKP